MIKIFNKLIFKIDSTKLQKDIISRVIDDFVSGRNKNLIFLVKQRFEWMQKFIKPNDIGLEVGAGAAFSKKLLKSKLIHTKRKKTKKFKMKRKKILLTLMKKKLQK